MLPVSQLAAEPALDRYCDLGEFGRPAGVAQLVERQLPKLNVEGSIPFTRVHAISEAVPEYVV